MANRQIMLWQGIDQMTPEVFNTIHFNKGGNTEGIAMLKYSLFDKDSKITLLDNYLKEQEAIFFSGMLPTFIIIICVYYGLYYIAHKII